MAEPQQVLDRPQDNYELETIDPSLRKLIESYRQQGSAVSLPDFKLQGIPSSALSAGQIYEKLELKIDSGSPATCLRPTQMIRAAVCHGDYKQPLPEFETVALGACKSNSIRPKSDQPKHFKQSIVFEQQEFKRLDINVRAHAAKTGATRISAYRSGLNLELCFQSIPGGSEQTIRYLGTERTLVIPSEQEVLEMKVGDYKEMLASVKARSGSYLSLSPSEFSKLGPELQEVLIQIGASRVNANTLMASEQIEISLASPRSEFSSPELPVEKLYFESPLSMEVSCSADCINVRKIKGIKADIIVQPVVGPSFTLRVTPRELMLFSDGKAHITGTKGIVSHTIKEELGADAFEGASDKIAELTALHDAKKDKAAAKAAKEYLSQRPELAAALQRRGDKYAGSRPGLEPEPYAVASPEDLASSRQVIKDISAREASRSLGLFGTFPGLFRNDDK